MVSTIEGGLTQFATISLLSLTGVGRQNLWPYYISIMEDSLAASPAANADISVRYAGDILPFDFTLKIVEASVSVILTSF